MVKRIKAERFQRWHAAELDMWRRREDEDGPAPEGLTNLSTIMIENLSQQDFARYSYAQTLRARSIYSRPQHRYGCWERELHTAYAAKQRRSRRRKTRRT